MNTHNKPTLMVIDGHSLAFRAFYALPPESFQTQDGQHTNAIHGFLSMLISLIDQKKPTHLAVAFDPSGPTFRHEFFPEYKGTRSETPEEFKGQVELLDQTLHAIGIPTISIPSFEADDVLATLSALGTDKDWNVFLVSGDRDTIQLINDHTTLLYPIKGVSTMIHFDEKVVVEKHGVTPAQYPDLAALVGETSDNIPGVPGVGPKTAAKWLGQFQNLDSILEHSDEIKGKVGENLRANLERVKLNRKINRLKTDVELPLTLEELEYVPPTSGAIEESFSRLEFRTLKTRAKKLLGAEDEEEQLAATIEKKFEQATAKDLASWTKESAPIAVFIQENDLQSCGLGFSNGESIYTTSAEGLTPEVKDFLADPAKPKVVYSTKDAYHAAARHGFTIAGIQFDAELAYWLLQPTKPAKNFAQFVLSQLGIEIQESNPDQLVPEVDEDTLFTHTGYLLESIPLLEERMDPASQKIFEEIDLPLGPILAEMEIHGIAIDQELLNSIATDLTQKVGEIEKAAYASINREVNLNSPKQLQDVLYNQLELKPTRATKTGFSTNAETLQDLALVSDHPFLELLLQYRDSNKLLQITQTLLKSVHEDGRIHTTFEQTGTATGRLSSLEPNLQNIPVRTEAGRQLRASFVHSAEAETLITADYSQIEMRIMAHLSEDEGLIEAFISGEDLHNFVGSQIFHVPPSEVSSEMRTQVKAMSYGLVYGLSAFGLSRQLRIDVGEAKNLMNGYFERFGKVRDYLRNVVEQARHSGYTETIFGRKRYFPELKSSNRMVAQAAQRAALNAPIQGSAADIIKKAMIAIHYEFQEKSIQSRMLLQVHDELVCEVYPGEFDAVEEIIVRNMQNATELSVPLDVHIGSGPNWNAAAH